MPKGIIHIKQVSGLIFSEDERLLLILDKDKHYLAGGKPEKFDEGIEATLHREVMEEVDVTIEKPYIVGYQYVDEENGSLPFAQVRMVALIKEVKPIEEDRDTGRIYRRLLVHH